MKAKLLNYILFILIPLACQEKEEVNRQDEKIPIELVSTPSVTETVHEPDATINGEYCASVSINDLEEKSISSENLIIKTERGYLKEIRNDDRTIVKDFQHIFFNEDGFTKFESNGKEYRINLLATLEDCYDGEVKGFSVQCVGKTKKGKRCRNKTLNETKLCWRHGE